MTAAERGIRLADVVIAWNVVAVPEGAPVEIGDVVVSLDGQPAEALLRSVASARSGSEQWKRAMAEREFGRGVKGTVAKLVVERAGTRVARDATRSVPDVPAERTIAGIRAGRDEVLDKGIEVIEQAATRG